MDAQAIRRWHAEYYPCDDGVHIYQPEGGEFGGITLKNFHGATLDIFRRHSSAGPEDDWDLVCDLRKAGDTLDDVCIRRQDLELIERELRGSPHA